MEMEILLRFRVRGRVAVRVRVWRVEVRLRYKCADRTAARALDGRGELL